jgi:subtilisin family serine protease
LARTEKYTEPFSEEENWLAAMEWADKNGADIISSSLGYSYHRYFQSDMDGQTSLVSRAALLAARKGMIVVNAMGNDGMSKWKVVVTPADTDSILSVGGIDPQTHIHIGFSSFGPTADMRMKPNVSAYGEVIVCGRDRLRHMQGTSFSTPLVTGFVACVWQMFPEKTNFEIMDMVQKSGHLYPYYDYAHGYGMPQASYFFGEKDAMVKTFDFVQHGDTITIELTDSIFTTPVSTREDYLYVHLADSTGVLKKYAIVKVTDMQVAHYPIHLFKEKKILRVYYKGYNASFSAIHLKEETEL